MIKLPFKDLGKKLRPRYQLAIIALTFITTLGSFIPTYLFGVVLKSLLGIPIHAAVKDQPNGALWMKMLLAFMMVAMVGGYLAGFLVLAMILKRRYRWSDDKNHRLMYDCEIPPHWLKPPS